MAKHSLLPAVSLVFVFIGIASAQPKPDKDQQNKPTKVQKDQFEVACQLLTDSGDSEQQKLVVNWKAGTGKVQWKDKSGEYSTTARYISCDDESVVLEKGDGSRITVAYDNLDFNGKVRVRKLGELKRQIIAGADAVRAKNAAQEKERSASMSPAEKRVRRFAKLQSDESLKKEKALQQEIMAADPETALRIRAGLSGSYKLLQQLEGHYKRRTLTADVVKKAINETGGGGGALKDLELLLFTGSPLLGHILVDEDKLITRADIYCQSGKLLTPEERKAFGFHYIDVFTRQGDKLHWQYMLDREIEANKEGSTTLEDPDKALSDTQ